MNKKYMNYNDILLGIDYKDSETAFALWAPTADDVKLNLYKTGDGDTLIKSVSMKKSEDGIWKNSEAGDFDGVYYTYSVTIGDNCVETHDPYAVACGVNGNRSMVVDLDKTNPQGFTEEKGPRYKNKTDIVVMEMSVADCTGDLSSNIQNNAKYLGLTEENVTSKDGISTGIDYIADMGVTHVQIMPSYDFASIDEADSEKAQYNWGYDPYNYNIPEGSYSTDPFNGKVRIKEFKQMVAAFHKKGIGVIMDVVYNHVYEVNGSCFQKTNPDYYFRKDGDRYSDASACGNEFASDMPMARKYIIDSLCYWVQEYHIDGFRFDLMGVLDIETMNQASKELHKINPDIILYGEGWTGGDSTLDADLRALKCNTKKLNGIGAFSDDFRDCVKGHVFELELPGFVNGADGKEEDVKKCISCCDWADRADQMVNYVSCHDNLTLWDKLIISCPKATDEERMYMNKLAAAMIFTAQGIPFFQMGEEFGRIKHDEDGNILENSYNVPLSINSIKYDHAFRNNVLREYYKGLIELRKEHDGFRMNIASDILDNISFIDVDEKNVVAYTIDSPKEKILVVYNAGKKDIDFKLPDDKEWNVYVNSENAGIKVLYTIKNQTQISKVSCLVAIQISE